MLSITPSGRSRRPRRGVEPRSRGSEPLVLSVIPTGQVADTVLMPSRGVEPRSPHFQYGAFPLSYNGFLRRASGSAQESNLDLEVRILPGFRYPNRAAANFYEPGGRTRSRKPNQLIARSFVYGSGVQAPRPCRGFQNANLSRGPPTFRSGTLFFVPLPA